jgi:Restriction endonuclease
MNEQQRVVFFSRCKPRYVDALQIALNNSIVFFGYPMRREGVSYNRHALKSCLVDPSCSETEWVAARRLLPEKQNQYRQNFNFVRKVGLNSIALIPRPSLGVVYCGRVNGSFNLVDDPEWYEDWERIWSLQYPSEDANRPDSYLAGEVAQLWHVDRFVPVPVPRIPAWIRRSLFGRSTYGIVPVDGIDPHVVMSDILNSPDFPVRGWTMEAGEVANRLKTDLVPASFEHLIVSLLQLEYPDEVWTQVGGSGDGGVDGIGADNAGRVVGLLQCKWAFHGKRVDWPDVWTGTSACRRYVASLIHTANVSLHDSSIFLGRDEITQLVLKHAAKLPLALSLRIGSRVL